MSTLVPGTEVVVTAGALDDGGAGVCAIDEGQLHVTGALPGEEVLATVDHLSPHRRATGERQAFGKVLQVLQPSAERVTPACPAHGECGGCPLQHLHYPAQLAWKTERLRSALVAAGVHAVVSDCLASPRPLGYRNQAKYVWGRTGDGTLTLGAYAPRSHALVDLVGCAVVEPPIDEVARALRELLHERAVDPFDEVRRTGVLRYVVLRASARGQVLCTLVTGGRRLEGGAALAARLQDSVPAVVGVVENVNASAGNVILGEEEHLLVGQAHLEEEIAGVRVPLGSRAFFQLNRHVAALAYAAIRRVVERRGPQSRRPRMVDLYAGLGGIGFALRDQVQSCVAVEENPAATAAGSAAARAAGITSMQFVTGRTDQLAGNALAGADLVVLNPPRAGAAAVVPRLLAATPQTIIYLSCNPATLARDLRALLASGKLRPVEIQPFDMLPHTPHIEALVVLESHPQT